MNCNMSAEGLVVEGAAPTEIKKGLQIQFDISGFKNPIQTGVMAGFTAMTKIMHDDEYYTVDYGETTFEVREYATLY